MKVPEPQFEGQTKTRLGNPEVSGQVQTVVGDALFAGSIGRTDFPGSDLAVLEQQLVEARARADEHYALYVRALAELESKNRVPPPAGDPGTG